MADNVEQEIQMQSVKDLIPYARNTRTHNEEQVGQIAAKTKNLEHAKVVKSKSNIG